MLRIQDLQVELPGFTLGPLSLQIERGEYFVLLGPSGAGKTTLLEWMAGFRPARAGRLLHDGRDITDLPPQDRNLGIVYQDAVLFPHMTVRENLAYPLTLRGTPAAEIRERIERLAGLLRISGRLDALPADISGGEARRAALGRALAAGQRTLLLDEPLTGLDPDLRRDLRHELGLLHHELGLTVVHITHHLLEARSLATRVGVLLDGNIAQVGAPRELFRRPADERVARFLMVRNFVSGTASVEDGRIEIAPGLAIPAPVVAPGPVLGRVRDLRLCMERNGGHCLRGRVRGYDVRSDGRHRAVVELYGSDAARIDLEVDTDEAHTYPPGSEVLVDFSDARWDLY